MNGSKGFDWSLKVVGRPDDGVEAADKLGLHGVLGPALRTPPAADTRGAYLNVQLDERTREVPPINQFRGALLAPIIIRRRNGRKLGSYRLADADKHGRVVGINVSHSIACRFVGLRCFNDES